MINVVVRDLLERGWMRCSNVGVDWVMMRNDIVLYTFVIGLAVVCAFRCFSCLGFVVLVAVDVVTGDSVVVVLLVF